MQQMRSSGKEPNHKKIELFIIAFFILTLWSVAVINPSILGMIESLGGPMPSSASRPWRNTRARSAMCS